MVGDEDGPEAAALQWHGEGVALIRLTQGASHNILTAELLTTLDRLLATVEREKARAVVVTGSGRTFCGGADVKLFTNDASPLYRNPRALRDDYVKGIVAVFNRLRDLPCPTIAAINGHAFGGGCELALACDFRMMAATARIGLTETRLGALAGAGGVQSLARLVGRSRALEIALLGAPLDASDAQAAGLVRSVHAADALETEALAFARSFLACSPISVAETKRALYRCETAEPAEADRIALDAVLAASAGDEWWEGMAAFAGKRRPAFYGEG